MLIIGMLQLVSFPSKIESIAGGCTLGVACDHIKAFSPHYHIKEKSVAIPKSCHMADLIVLGTLGRTLILFICSSRTMSIIATFFLRMHEVVLSKIYAVMGQWTGLQDSPLTYVYDPRTICTHSCN